MSLLSYNIHDDGCVTSQSANSLFVKLPGGVIELGETNVVLSSCSSLSGLIRLWLNMGWILYELCGKWFWDFKLVPLKMTIFPSVSTATSFQNYFLILGFYYFQRPICISFTFRFSFAILCFDFTRDVSCILELVWDF